MCEKPLKRPPIKLGKYRLPGKSRLIALTPLKRTWGTSGNTFTPHVGVPWGSQVSAAAHLACLPIVHGSVECRGIPPRPIVPTGVSPRSYNPTTNQSQAFRDNRNFGYWRMGEERRKREERKCKNREK